MQLARHIQLGLLVGVAIWLHAAFAPSAQLTSMSEQDRRIDEFLDRLGLTELQALHLEQSLDKELDAARQQALVTRLADLYAAQLLSYWEDQTRYDATLHKIDRLIERAPGARTPALEAMLLQADYNRAEKLMGQWLANRADQVARDQARQILQRIAPELDRLRQTLQGQLDQLQEELDKLPPRSDRAATEHEAARVQAILGRASYFSAWSHYYLGLAQGSRDGLDRARDGFRLILGLSDDDDELDAEYLGLSSIWRARSLVGLALAESALGDQDRSRRSFDLLKDASVPPEIREQAAYWELQALLNVERHADAEKLARREIAAMDETATQGAVSFCASLVRATYGNATPSAELRRLGLLGLSGLAKIGQRRTALQLMTQYEIRVGEDAGFYLQGLEGQQQFERAEQTKQQADFALAETTLAAALKWPEAEQDLSSAGQCRSQRGWCLYRLGQHEAAGREFKRAAEQLTAARDQRAVESAWMSFVAFQAAAESQPALKVSAIDMLQLIQRDFPRHEYAKRAAYYLGKLQHHESPEETLRSLQQVATDAPDYLAARYEICQLLHRGWAKADEGERTAAAQQLREAVDVYLEAKGDADKARQAKACLLAADATLHGPAQDLSAAAAYLKRAEALTAALPSSHAVLAEYHFRALELAQSQSDPRAERLHAAWLVKQAAGSSYELPALIVMARALDQALPASDASPAQLEEAYTLYRRLVQLLGESAAEIQAHKNAQVANSKLAHYAEALGKHAEAARRLDLLLEALPGPKNKNYLRRAALAHYRAGQHETALSHWRTLLRGVPQASEEWFEAKYYQLACLMQTDPGQARIVFDQFKLLHPDLGPPSWRERFAELQP